jgi:hypothetical protein
MFKSKDYKLVAQSKCLVAKRDGIEHIIYFDGDEYWYKNGGFHRLDGPAIVRPNETTKWYKDGKLHRLDGPAIEYVDGTKVWFKDGELHRLDGPAIERADGIKEWWENGQKIK